VVHCVFLHLNFCPYARAGMPDNTLTFIEI